MEADEPTETYFLSDGHNDVASTSGNGTGFVVTEGPLAGSRFLLDRDISTLGRHPKSDLFFDDITVSRRHAEVKISANLSACTRCRFSKRDLCKYDPNRQGN